MSIVWVTYDENGEVVKMTQEEWLDSWHKPIMAALKAQFDKENHLKEEIEKSAPLVEAKKQYAYFLDDGEVREYQETTVWSQWADRVNEKCPGILWSKVGEGIPRRPFIVLDEDCFYKKEDFCREGEKINFSGFMKVQKAKEELAEYKKNKEKEEFLTFKQLVEEKGRKEETVSLNFNSYEELFDHYGVTKYNIIRGE
jgi:hypothetical protein